MIDKQIIKDARNKNTEAINIIIKEHEKLIYSIVNSFSINCSDYDLSKEDMFQEGLIGLMQAIESYNFEKGTKFSTFAYPIIFRRVSKEYKKQYTRYFEECFSYSKLDEIDRFILTQTTYVGDIPEMYVDTRSKSDLLFELVKDLDEEDKTILQLRLLSYTYDEIAQKLNTTSRKVDYRLRKIRKEIKDKKKLLYI